MDREALVAQGTDKKGGRLCDRCFASLPPTEAFCPECGAAIVDGGTEESDNAVYPELARANLLRMRGDYKVAEEQCLTILRRYPNNVTANILLGDISAEKGDLEAAMQWYELAIDLVPDNAAAQHKLNQVRDRFKAQETAATVEQLGLPTTKSRAGVYAVALIASIFVIAVVAYFLGQRVQQNRNGVNTPIVVGKDNPTFNRPPENTPTKTLPREDQELLDTLKNNSPNGSRLIGAMQDPRSKVMVLTYSALDGEDARTLGALIARDAFREANDALVVTVRGMTRGTLVFAADALRSRYEEVLTSIWKENNASDPDAWIDHVLTNEWSRTSATQQPQGQDQMARDELPPGEEPPSSAVPAQGGPPPVQEPAPPAGDTGLLPTPQSDGASDDDL